MSTRDGRGEWPVFILSGLRSGSTLLRYLLDAHEHLACPPETKFLSALEQLTEYPQVLPALRTLGLSPLDVARELRLFTERVLGSYARSVNKRRWVDKTPSYYRLTPFIEQMFEGEVLYIVLVRHPLDCIASLGTEFHQTTRHEDPDIARSTARFGTGRYAWAQYWLDVYARLHVFHASCPQRTTIVRYEDLVTQPHEQLQQVLRFLDEPYEPSIVARAFASVHTDGYGDDRIRRTSAVHADSVDRYRQWPAAEIEALWDVVRPAAERFGYTIDINQPAAR